MILNPALELAVADFRKSGLKEIDLRSGAALDAEKITVRYLNCDYSIYLPQIEWAEGVSLREKIVILHYLTRSKGTPPSGRQIDFREVPGGNLYYSIFEARVCRPLLKTFGNNPELIEKAFSPLNGKMANWGDFSIVIPVFPKVPVTFVIYKGDGELPANCKVLFDSGISDYLTTEDIVVVCEDTTSALINNVCS